MIKELLYKWFKLEEKPCESCETLKMQLAISNREKEQLLNTILAYSQPKAAEVPVTVNYDKLTPRPMTWNVRRALLEAEDAKTAQLMAEQRRQAVEIAKLEKEVGVANDEAVGGSTEETVQP